MCGCFLGSVIERAFESNGIGTSFKDSVLLSFFFSFLINLRLLPEWSSWMKVFEEHEVNGR